MEIQTKQQEKSQGSDTSCSRFSEVTKSGSNNKYGIKHQKHPLFCRIFLFFQKFFMSDFLYNIAASLV